MRLTEEEVERAYEELEVYWEKNLKKMELYFARLKSKDKFTKDALVLVYLYLKYKKIVSKDELTSFIQQYYPQTNDVQQARHLAQQKGWYILLGLEAITKL